MAKNTYSISVTLLHTVTVEADNEKDALDMVSDALHDEGYGELCVENTEVEDVIEDGPANYERFRAQCDAHTKAVDTYGKDSAEAKAAYAAIDFKTDF